MISNRNIVVSLDIGTNTIKAALAEVLPGQDLNILGITRVPSLGLRKGSIIDIESTAKAIDECLNALEKLTGIEIMSAVVGFSGASISIINNHAVVAVGNPDYEITLDDKERVLQSARNIGLPPDKVIVHTIERQYIVDGYDGVKDPVGMAGSRLECEVAIILSALAAIQNIRRSAARINLELERVIYNPLLASEAVLIPNEKEMGVALVDIGAGVTTVSYFEKGSILYTAVIPVGGEYITKDLAIVLHTSLDEAERIKISSGVVSPEMAEQDKMIEIQNLQGRESRQVSQEVIADIISARVVEIMEMVYAELNSFGCLDRLYAGIVLTGGGANLTGIAPMAEEYLNIPVRTAVPENLRGIATDFNKPENAAVLGGAIYAARTVKMEYAENSFLPGLINKLTDWFKDLFR
ncbi:MAG: cell division protein FtsA [Syntrophomonadaceae bacterium]|nr:cell division protein FtsA [Syntrophomonadaceae bacterium]